jgi:hypothetical protein
MATLETKKSSSPSIDRLRSAPLVSPIALPASVILRRLH